MNNISKELLVPLMQSYVDDLKKENELIAFLDDIGIGLEIRNTILISALEVFFEKIDSGIVSALIDLGFDDCTTINDKVITTVEGVYDELFGSE